MRGGHTGQLSIGRTQRLAALAAVAVFACAACASAAPVVYALQASGTVSPPLSDYYRRGLKEAQAAKAEAVVLVIDTPGGLLDSTREIVTQILLSETPVITYVYPQGGRAASAGAFIVIAGHVAAMAPGTNIGASSPVFMGGGGEGTDAENEQLKTLLKKATEDAAAFMRALAEKRGRNVAWAERAVREGVAISAEEAVRLHVVDLIAANPEELLDRVDGRTVQLEKDTRTLHTKGARIVETEMTAREQFLLLISHPNVAYILLLIGVYGILFELYSPGIGGSGILGAICLILGLYSLSVLNANWAGVALILLSVGLFLAELKVQSHGLLAAGGVVSLLFGSLILFPQGDLRVSLPLIIAMTVVTAGFILFALTFVILTYRRQVTTGAEGLVGKRGEVRVALAPEGQVFCDGALWQAVADEPVEKGAKVEIVAVEGLRLQVRRWPAPETEHTSG
jgi:membrane-bound serine protease (ClpP class)